MMPAYCGINKEWLKEHDNQMREEGAKAERDQIFTALREACVSRSWVDSDGDAHYGALTLEEIREAAFHSPGQHQEREP